MQTKSVQEAFHGVHGHQYTKGDREECEEGYEELYLKDEVISDLPRWSLEHPRCGSHHRTWRGLAQGRQLQAESEQAREPKDADRKQCLIQIQAQTQ